MTARWLLALMALVLVSAHAGAEESEPSPASGAGPKSSAGDTEEEAKVELEGESHYRAAGSRDPFRPFMLDLQVSESPRTPLQKYELGQLTLAGVVLGVDPPRAMVEDNIGMGYIVTVGTPIGRNGGVVTDISNHGVTVEETMRDFFGEELVKQVVMELPSGNGADKPGLETRE